MLMYSTVAIASFALSGVLGAAVVTGGSVINKTKCEIDVSKQTTFYYFTPVCDSFAPTMTLFAGDIVYSTGNTESGCGKVFSEIIAKETKTGWVESKYLKCSGANGTTTITDTAKPLNHTKPLNAAASVKPVKPQHTSEKPLNATHHASNTTVRRVWGVDVTTADVMELATITANTPNTANLKYKTINECSQSNLIDIFREEWLTANVGTTDGVAFSCQFDFDVPIVGSCSGKVFAGVTSCPPQALVGIDSTCYSHMETTNDLRVPIIPELVDLVFHFVNEGSDELGFNMQLDLPGKSFDYNYDASFGVTCEDVANSL